MREISAELRRRLAKCKQFDGSIPCWMFRGNEEVKIKQWQEIRRLNKCIVEVTYNGRDWYMSGNTDLNRIFDSDQEAKDGIAANLRRYPNDVTVRRIRHLLSTDEQGLEIHILEYRRRSKAERRSKR